MKTRWIDRQYDAFLRRMGLREAYELKQTGYLKNRGWFRSFEEGRMVDEAGKAIPWMNYSVVDFLEERLAPSWRVFEYGSGGSTAWWAARVA